MIDETLLRELYLEKGYSTYQVAELAGCDQKTVWNWLRRLGIKTRRRGHNLNGVLGRVAAFLIVMGFLTSPTQAQPQGEGEVIPGWHQIQDAAPTWPIEPAGHGYHVLDLSRIPWQTPSPTSENKDGMTFKAVFGSRPQLPDIILGYGDDPLKGRYTSHLRVSFQRWPKGSWQQVRFHSDLYEVKVITAGYGNYMVGDFSVMVGAGYVIRIGPDTPHAWMFVKSDEPLEVTSISAERLPSARADMNPADWAEIVNRERENDLGRDYHPQQVQRRTVAPVSGVHLSDGPIARQGPERASQAYTGPLDKVLAKPVGGPESDSAEGVK